MARAVAFATISNLYREVLITSLIIYNPTGE